MIIKIKKTTALYIALVLSMLLALVIVFGIVNASESDLCDHVQAAGNCEEYTG